MSNLTAIFLSVILQSFPYIIIGAGASAVLEVFIPTDLIKRLSKGNKVCNIFIFALFGFIMPICECGIIPVIKRLRDKGVPAGPLIAYLLAAPAFQPIVFFSTYSAFNNNLKIALYRCFGSFVIAVIIAFIMRNDKSEKVTEKNSNHHSAYNSEDCCGHHHCNCAHSVNDKRDKLAHFMITFINDFMLILKFLVIGAAFSAVFSFYNPIDLYNNPEFVNTGSIFVMMIMAIVLSVCSEADAFVAYSFNYFPIASKMAFMWIGPILDIKLIILYASIFNKKFMLKIFVTSFILVTIFSLVYAFLKL